MKANRTRKSIAKAASIDTNAIILATVSLLALVAILFKAIQFSY